jgi:hypothetical protein
MSATVLLLLSASAFTPPLLRNSRSRSRPVVGSAVTSVPAEVAPALDICRAAAKDKTEDPEAVCEALLQVEKQMRAAAKDDNGELSRATLAALDGAWRLVFTTGTVETQSKLGRKINYFPLRATQTFDTTAMPMAISNGIFLGDVALLKFFGTFEWLEDVSRRTSPIGGRERPIHALDQVLVGRSSSSAYRRPRVRSCAHRERRSGGSSSTLMRSPCSASGAWLDST